jgi:hypothetical protein
MQTPESVVAAARAPVVISVLLKILLVILAALAVRVESDA